MATNVFELFGKIGAKDEASKVIDNVVAKAKSADHTLSSGLGKIGSMASGAGEKLTSAITKPALGAATALTGITLVKGFNRLTGIDDARAKLLGLGHDGKSVEKIMKSALASVKGTSFGMDEAATTAAGAVAAGVKSGESLTKYLSLTADAAAIAGTSMSEMGSIINKVQTGQQAYTDDLNQLADRGLPIYQWIAKEANVAASEVKDLASSGEVSSEMFLNAIEKNIGGAAQIMGENSFKASIANIGASIGRIGANFLDAGGKGGGFFSTLKPLLAEFNNSMGGLEEKASEFGVKFGQAFQKVIDKALELKSKFDALDPKMQSMVLKSAAMWAGVLVGAGPVLKVFGTFATGLSKAMFVIETFNGAATGLFAKLGAGLSGMAPQLLSFAGMFISILGPAAIGGALLAGLGVIQSQFGSQLDSFFQMAQTKGPGIIQGLVTGIVSKLPDLMAQGTVLLNNLLNTITANLPVIIQGGADIIVSLIKGFAENIPKIIPTILNLANILIQNIILIAPYLVQAGLQLILALAQGIVQNIPTLISMIATLGPMLLQQLDIMLIEIFMTLGGWIVQGLINIKNSVAIKMMEIVQSIQQKWTELITWLGPFAVRLATWALDTWNKVKSVVFQRMIEIYLLILTKWNEAIAWMTGIAGRIYSIVSNAFSQALNAVIQKMQSIVSTIQSKWNAAISWMGSLPGRLWSAASTALQRMLSAVSEKANQVKTNVQNGWDQAIDFLRNINLMQLGRDAIEGFIGGIKQKISDVGNAVASVANKVKDGITSILDIHSPSRVLRGLGVNTIQGYVEGVHDQEQDVKNSMDRIAQIVKGTSFDVQDISFDYREIPNLDNIHVFNRPETDETRNVSSTVNNGDRPIELVIKIGDEILGRIFTTFNEWQGREINIQGQF